MTKNKALYTRDDVDRLYVSEKEGRRELINMKNSINASMQRIEDYIIKRRRIHQKRYWQHEDQQNGNNQKKNVK